MPPLLALLDAVTVLETSANDAKRSLAAFALLLGTVRTRKKLHHKKVAQPMRSFRDEALLFFLHDDFLQEGLLDEHS